MSASDDSKKKKFYISDHTLFRRVKEYVLQNEDPLEVDKDSMVEFFRNRYLEYGRRQRSAFRTQMLRMYKIVQESIANEDELPDNSEGDENSTEFVVSPLTGALEKAPKNLEKAPKDLEKAPKDLEKAPKDFEKASKDSETADNKVDNQVNESDDKLINDDSENVGNGNQLPTNDVDDEEGNENGSVEDDEANDEDDNEDDNIDYIDESMEDLDENEAMQTQMSYMDRINTMANSLKQKPISITISSDEEEEEPIQRYPHIFQRNGPVNIQRIPGVHERVSIYKNQQKLNPNMPHLPSMKVKFGKRDLEEAEIPTPKKRKLKMENICFIPNVSFKCFGGFSKILQTVSELVVHVKEAAVYKALGAKPPRGFLLHGPPGCGKTLLAQAIAGELEIPLLRVAGPELVAGVSGESESRIRDLFDSALEQAPCILFIDEIDAICPPRETARREMERRIVAQLLTCIDSLGDTGQGDKVVIIGATNRPDALDPALRRAGRFDREVCLGIPDRDARKDILQVITKDMKLKPGLDIEKLSACTPGFVGADLKALTSEASIAAVNRCLAAEREKIQNKPIEAVDKNKLNGSDNNEKESSNDSPSNSKDKPENKEEAFAYLSLLKSSGPLLTPEQLSDLYIEMEDFNKALKSVQPSAKREGFATVPDVTWDDIGSLQDIRNELEKSIMMPVKYPNEFALLGINAPTGILLCGPPGCGKTLLAKAVANEANINFISVKGPELLNMYVGESERAVRQCFQRARNSQPCVIFFDEFDALCPKRGGAAEGHNATSRVVNQVLTEMDGVEGRAGVFLMAATNRPDMVDPAVLRPGRLDKILFVDLPTASDRADILKALTKNGTKPPMNNVDLDIIGCDARLEGYSGADLAALIKEASLLALTEYIRDKEPNQLFVTSDMIYQACDKIRPSVTEVERLHYKSLKALYGMPASTNSLGSN